MTSKTPNLNSSLPALQHVTSASQDGQGSDPNVLPGRYKVFFAPDAHARVSQWYHERANLDQRHEFKRLVKAISNFDGEAEKKKLRVGFTPSVTPAHAVLMHNGADIIDPSFHDRVVLYLALAKPAELHAFRNVFGQIDPPTTTKLAKTHYTSQFADGTKYMKGELMLRDTSKKVVGKGHVLPPSHPTTAPCEVVGDGKSQYGLFYAWKVAPKTKANVVQKAHESSSHGAPWGEYGGGRWVPQTKEDFEDREYRAPKVVGEGPDAKVIVEARRFQNYNDNLSHDVYRTQRLLRKQRRLPGEFAAQTSLMFSTAPTAEVMKPQRPIPPPPAPSPIFCR